MPRKTKAPVMAAYERPEYLQNKVPPAGHAIGSVPEYTPPCKSGGHADVNPLKPVTEVKSRRITHLVIAAGLVLAVAVLVCLDLLCFASTNLNFTLTEFWSARFDALRSFRSGLIRKPVDHTALMFLSEFVRW